MAAMVPAHRSALAAWDAQDRGVPSPDVDDEAWLHARRQQASLQGMVHGDAGAPAGSAYSPRGGSSHNAAAGWTAAAGQIRRLTAPRPCSANVNGASGPAAPVDALLANALCRGGSATHSNNFGLTGQVSCRPENCSVGGSTRTRSTSPPGSSDGRSARDFPTKRGSDGGRGFLELSMQFEQLEHRLDEERVALRRKLEQEHAHLRAEVEASSSAWRREAERLAAQLTQMAAQLAQASEAAVWAGKELAGLRAELGEVERQQREPCPKAQAQAAETAARASQARAELQAAAEAFDMRCAASDARVEELRVSVDGALQDFEERLVACGDGVAYTNDFLAQAVSSLSRDVARLSAGLGAVEAAVGFGASPPPSTAAAGGAEAAGAVAPSTAPAATPLPTPPAAGWLAAGRSGATGAAASDVVAAQAALPPAPAAPAPNAALHQPRAVSSRRPSVPRRPSVGGASARGGAAAPEEFRGDDAAAHLGSGNDNPSSAGCRRPSAPLLPDAEGDSAASIFAALKAARGETSASAAAGAPVELARKRGSSSASARR
eukprot:TRINITY_DN3726_c0_g1_i1.p1 TRINITY_DN3726_c0_g1~~TRINITY_DN3726_c0_g1_i1.p1  ORF type:complete len:619 (-),score=147.06 TRINITY_DN3726_c0_g1_i1:77-1723(-)